MQADRTSKYSAYVCYASSPSVDEARIPVQSNDPWRKLEIELGRAVVECTTHNSVDGTAITVTAPMVMQLSFTPPRSPPSSELPPPSAVRYPPSELPHPSAVRYPPSELPHPSAVRYRLEHDTLVVTLVYPGAPATTIVIDVRQEVLRSDQVTDLKLRFPISYHLEPRSTAYQALKAAGAMT